MKKYFQFFFILFLMFFTRPAHPSQVRVDSIGDLLLVVTDETADINPYNLGNPAGLVLLPSQTRLEFSVPWYSLTNRSGSSYSQNYGISAGSSYQGFLNVSKDNWAVQTGGSFDSADSEWLFSPSQGNSQNGLGLIQGAGALGLFNFGAEFQIDASSFNSSPESFNQSSMDSTVGLLANIQLAENNHPVWLRVGNSFFFNAGPEQVNYFFNNSSASVTDTYKTSINIWEPSVFLDIPGTFQGGIVTAFNGNSSTEATSSSNTSVIPNILTHIYDNENNFFLTALYKWKLVLSSHGDPHPLTFNNGCRLEIADDNETQFQSNGSAFITSNESSSRFQSGIGLERDKDFTVGIQVNLFKTNSMEIFTGQPNINYPFSMNQVSVGGEKWISPNWALRLGLTFEDDNDPIINNNGSTASEGYYEIYPGQEVQGIFVSAGAGYEDKVLTVDGRIWFEQPQSIGQGLTGPGYADTLFGAELSFALFWGP